MTNSSKTIILFGTEDFSLKVLLGLLNAGYRISAVVTKPDSKKGRGKILSAPSVKQLALKYNIPVLQPNKIAEINNIIQNSYPNSVGILASFGRIIPKSTLELFNPGIINIHPSLLPKYRGPSPIESAIKNGDTKTGVSIIKLVPEMDAGPIYGKIEYQLTGKETQPSLYDKLASIGTDFLVKLLPQILNDSLKPVPQNELEASYCSLLNKEDSWLDQSTLTSTDAEKMIRAHLEYPKTKFNINNHTIIALESHSTNLQSTPLDIRFKDNTYLSIDKLIAPSGRVMTAKDFLNGYLK